MYTYVHFYFEKVVLKSTGYEVDLIPADVALHWVQVDGGGVPQGGGPLLNFDIHFCGDLLDDDSAKLHVLVNPHHPGVHLAPCHTDHEVLHLTRSGNRCHGNHHHHHHHYLVIMFSAEILPRCTATKWGFSLDSGMMRVGPSIRNLRSTYFSSVMSFPELLPASHRTGDAAQLTRPSRVRGDKKI